MMYLKQVSGTLPFFVCEGKPDLERTLHDIDSIEHKHVMIVCTYTNVVFYISSSFSCFDN